MNNVAGQTHIVEVWGDFACFSRPENSVERFSYPCPNPSAARGIFEAIYFKPEFRWRIERIELLSPPAYIALRRNEVKDTISVPAIYKWMLDQEATVEPLLADDSGGAKGRTQRQTMAIRQPHYRLHGSIVPRSGREKQQQAFDSQFVRRASQGKCFQQPCFGAREFVAFFRYLKTLDDQPAPCNHTQDIGFMVYDLFDLDAENDRNARPFISVFKATIAGGVLEVPAFNGPHVLKPERSEA